MTRDLVWVEAARSFSCALVVLAHVNQYTRAGLETYWPGGMLLWPALSATVPCFLVISGYLAAGSQPRRLGSELRRIVLPFLVWNVIMVLLTRSGEESISTALLDLATGSKHLYFLFVMLQLRLLYRAARRLDTRGRRAACIAAVLASFAYYAFADVTLWRRTFRDVDDIEALLHKPFVGWAVFYVTGILAAHYPSARDWLSGRVAWLASATALFFVGYSMELHLEESIFGHNARRQFLMTALPFQLCFSLLVLLTLERAQRSGAGARIVGWMARAGRDTFGIYLGHFALLILSFAALQATGLANAHWLEVPVLAGTVWIAALLLVRAARRFSGGPLGWVGEVVLGVPRLASPPAVQNPVRSPDAAE